jgi:hypothetical protein
MVQKWYQSVAYDFPLSRWIFFFNSKGFGPLNLKKMFFSSLINLCVAFLVNLAQAAKLCFSGSLGHMHFTCD